VKGKTVTVLGLTFKPETDDMRDAPSLDIVPALIERGATVRAHDPQGMKEAKHLLPESVVYCDTPYDAARDSDAVVIVTEWNEYRALDLPRLAKGLRGAIMVDLRNIYDIAEVERAGFSYTGVGR
jgi:UDPglucose 6-dehydrogenase